MSDKPALWPYIRDSVGLDDEPDLTPPIALEISLAGAVVSNEFAQSHATYGRV